MRIGFWRWLWYLLRGYRVLITYNVDTRTKRFNEELYFRRFSQKQIYGMGYVRGKKIKDELKFLPFKIYVRFAPDIKPPHPVLIMDDEGNVRENWETSSTMHDHWRSDSTDQFLKGMTKTVLPGGDQKTLIILFMIIACACVAVYFFFIK